MASKSSNPETQRSKLERKEAAILLAARSVFIDNGFDGARMSEIARQAEIGEGTIYSYFDSKAELMLAVLQQFWDSLTREARAFMAPVQDETFAVRVHALATYHLDAVIQNADFINLTFALRRNNSEVSVSQDHLRKYVAVFDEIFRRGQDRGELRQDAVLWQARDLFYGSLEYSSRSIAMTFDSSRTERQQNPVVANLVQLFDAHYGLKRVDANDGLDAVSALARIESKIDQLLK